MSPLVLHGYWRSTAAYRVRIALSLKGVPFDQEPHDLRTGGHRTENYLSRTPQGLVPALQTENLVITQSLAIIEWLEERFPTPPLLPSAPADRAVVRSMADLIACDIHPLNNLRVLQVLRSDLAASEAQVAAWIGRWIAAGFSALEQLVERYGGAFSFADTPGLADCALIPQIYSARRFGVDMADYPLLVAVEARANALAAFGSAHPSRQPDADLLGA